MPGIILGPGDTGKQRSLELTGIIVSIPHSLIRHVFL